MIPLLAKLQRDIEKALADSGLTINVQWVPARVERTDVVTEIPEFVAVQWYKEIDGKDYGGGISFMDKDLNTWEPDAVEIAEVIKHDYHNKVTDELNKLVV